ncbi:MULTISPECIES: DUF1385 domain-containing protein [Paenibacillus]|uniref:Metal-dependent enzyme n=2 Tax=Paenibacillus TaxID=44249 RepID=A0A1V4HR05_9BACL|nr:MULTISPECIES: DUF1385 domain-containing protein [Paenibacillus]MEC0230892.1 DUF1385 domain-containing protein [Paenibacillus alba]NQX65040.1 DUF1385 domain-containing protein [Paenibacillus alba]OPH60777.1 hypothetical protein BC351_16390 [Paenibacillus ferrarius]
MAEQNSIYGGQAVIEGVMFAGKNVHVTAVRKKDGSLDYLEVPKKVIPWVQSLKKIPFIRGIVGIIESSAKGAQHLNFSAESFAEQEGDNDKNAQKEEKPGFFSNISMILGVAVVGVISFLFGKFVFTLVPAVIEQFLFQNVFSNQILHNLIEGVIKIILLVGYIYFISLTPMIRRLFQYHGAEHKVISAYEAGVELTVSNVQKFNTLHYRCGSSFIVFTVLIGVVIYSFLHYDGYVERILQRLLLLPVVIGVSYEVLRFTNSLREVPVLRYLGYPGLWLQLLTTKEPEDHQVEVSIASFNRMREAEQRITEGRV